MKNKGLLVCLFLAVPVFMYSQTAQAIEELLDTQTVSMEQAAWLVLEAAATPYQTFIPYAASAFRHAADQGWVPETAQASDSIRLDQASLLIMRAFGIRGGIFYSLTGNPRYAYRELTYLNVIQGRSVPGMTVSGEQLLFMISRILSQFVNEDLQMAGPAGRPAHYIVLDQNLAEEIRTELEAQDIADVTVELTAEGVMISLSDIIFGADSAVLPEAEREKIQSIAQVLKLARVRSLLIAGHTALAGTAQGRQQVSQERAQAVKDYLVYLGVLEDEHISVIGYGAERPIADNNTPEGMARNRRVEIIILEHN